MRRQPAKLVPECCGEEAIEACGEMPQSVSVRRVGGSRSLLRAPAWQPVPRTYVDHSMSGFRKFSQAAIQNGDTRTVQLKLDELIRSTDGRNVLLDWKDLRTNL
jgi:hypothetical protein